MSRIPLLLTAGALAAAASRRVLRNWGATKAECAEYLPGDELVPDPAVTTTRAVTVEAPAEAIWPWLAQMGQDRAGMYSYDRLENLVGLHIHSADAVQPQWQDLGPGDPVRLVPRGWLGLDEGYTLTVARADPPHTLVLCDETWHSIWSFHVVAIAPHLSRLISRSRAPRSGGPLAVAAGVLDPITLMMTRRMLLGIKTRAEATPDGRYPVAPTADASG
jgi:hypothetical protein